MSIVLSVNVDKTPEEHTLDCVSTINALCRDYYRLRNKYSKYGAADSEIDWHWQRALSDFINEKEGLFIPVLPSDWDLFEDYKMKWKVACKLTDNLLRIFGELNNWNPDKSTDTYKVWERQFREEWLWRVSR